MPELSLQLYSARHTPLNDALKIIAEAGYSSVEAYGDNFVDITAFQQGLKANGLTVASAHVGLDELLTNMTSTMSILSSLGTSHVVCPYLLPENRPTNKSGWLELTEQLSRINNTLSASNYTFAWHNHDFEFDVLPGGEIPMQLLLDNAPSMHWEVDIGWIVRAGAEPNFWLKNYANRISAIHLKDVAKEGECTDEDGWADVGHGVIDWSDLLGNIKQTSARLFITEHDNPSNLARFAGNSFDSISAWKW